MSDKFDWVSMTFDPEVNVNVQELIRLMKGEVGVISKGQWEDAKESCADILEQFVALRKALG